MIADDSSMDAPEDSDEPEPKVDTVDEYGNVHQFPPIPQHLNPSGRRVSYSRRISLGHENGPATASTRETSRTASVDFPSRTEKTKLLAGYLNTVASGFMVTGVVGPIANYLYGTTSTTSHSPWWLVGEIFALITASICMHLMARGVLGRLDR